MILSSFFDLRFGLQTLTCGKNERMLILDSLCTHTTLPLLAFSNP